MKITHQEDYKNKLNMFPRRIHGYFRYEPSKRNTFKYIEFAGYIGLSKAEANRAWLPFSMHRDSQEMPIFPYAQYKGKDIPEFANVIPKIYIDDYNGQESKDSKNITQEEHKTRICEKCPICKISEEEEPIIGREMLRVLGIDIIQGEFIFLS